MLLEITLFRHTPQTQILRHCSCFIILVLSALLRYLQITHEKIWLSWLSRALSFNNFVFLSSLPQGYKFPVMCQFIKIMQYNAANTHLSSMSPGCKNISFKCSIDKHSTLQHLILACVTPSLQSLSVSISGHEYQPLFWHHTL